MSTLADGSRKLGRPACWSGLVSCRRVQIYERFEDLLVGRGPKQPSNRLLDLNTESDG